LKVHLTAPGGLSWLKSVESFKLIVLLVGALIGASAAFPNVAVFPIAKGSGQKSRISTPPSQRLDAASGGHYLGSKACASCHSAIYNNFRQTSMGRSMLPGETRSLDGVLPPTAKVYDKDSDQYFDVRLKGGSLYQGDYAVDADGKELFRQSWKLDYVIGAGANGYGFLFQRDHYLFEAPLCYYTTTHSWGFSPGFEVRNRGFTRPILDRCITCHSGRSNPVTGQVGLYENPPFEELAVGCENCHGPGEAHVTERTQDQMTGAAPPLGIDASIVNPAQVSGWVADNICMRCHQGQDVRVEMPGKRIQDFRPGMQLGEFVSIFKIAPEPGASPSALPLEHYFGMTLSKCYRASGNLHCVTCHDPHVESNSAQSYTKYRATCMGCHTEQSCKLERAKRQATNPPDDCLSCHMPKRTVTTIAHAALTDHSIPMRPSAVMRKEASQSSSSRELLLLTATPDSWKKLRAVPEAVVFQAYDSLVRQGREEFAPLLNELLPKIERSETSEPNVLRALSRAEFSKNTAEDDLRALQFMKRVERTTTLNIDDYLLLSNLYKRGKQPREAVKVLEKARTATPYFREVYEILAEEYMELGEYGDALGVLRKGIELFPDDLKLRSQEKKASAATLGP